jgi:hypothetical protein
MSRQDRPELTEQQFAWADRLIAWCLSPPQVDELNEFETDFCNSLADRLGRYQRRAHLSEKQIEVLKRLHQWRQTGEKPRKGER